jgi:acyl-CoA thioesterase YciA
MTEKVNKLEAVHSFTVMPKDLNYSDSLFGGKIMYEMDYAGAKVVRRALYGTECDGLVTASAERIDFNRPAFQGDIVTMVATIKSLGRSSIQVRIKVRREGKTGETEQICAANFTFVSMKDNKSYAHGLCFNDLIDNK